MTSSEPKAKAREFWLYERENRQIGDPDWESAFEYPDALVSNFPPIHLIEYLAFAEAKEREALLVKRLKQLLCHDHDLIMKITEKGVTAELSIDCEQLRNELGLETK